MEDATPRPNFLKPLKQSLNTTTQQDTITTEYATSLNSQIELTIHLCHPIVPPLSWVSKERLP